MPESPLSQEDWRLIAETLEERLYKAAHTHFVTMDKATEDRLRRVKRVAEQRSVGLVHEEET